MKPTIMTEKKRRLTEDMDKISIIIPCFNEEEALSIYYKEMKKSWNL